MAPSFPLCTSVSIRGIETEYRPYLNEVMFGKDKIIDGGGR